MKIGFNSIEGELWAAASGYEPAAEDLINIPKEHLSCYVVNRHGEIISAFHPYEDLYELEVNIKRYGMEDFKLKTTCEMYKPIFHGQLVKIYSAKNLIGICKIDDIKQKDATLTLKGKGLQKVLYDYKLKEFGASSRMTKGSYADKIIEGVLEEALRHVREEYPLLLPIDIIDLPLVDAFPSFDIKDNSKVGDILETVNELLGGGCYYGFDAFGYLFFSARVAKNYQYLHQEQLSDYDISLDTTNIRNRVRAMVTSPDPNWPQDAVKATPYAEDRDSQARYGVYSEDVDMWFLGEENDGNEESEPTTVTTLSQALLVGNPQYSGNFKSQKYIDIFAPLVISGVYDQTKREILTTLKDESNFSLSGNLKAKYQSNRYTLGDGAFLFEGSGTITLYPKERTINMDYLIFNLSGRAKDQQVKIRIYWGIFDEDELDFQEEMLSIADLPNHTRDYIIRDVKSVARIELEVQEARLVIDHVGYVHRVQDVTVIPESYSISLKGNRFEMKVSVGQEQSFSKIFKKLGKQARLQHQYLLGRNRYVSEPERRMRFVKTSALPEAPSSPQSFILKDRRESDVYAALNVFGLYLPYKDILYVYAVDEKGKRHDLEYTTFTPIEGEYRHHLQPLTILNQDQERLDDVYYSSAPLAGLLEIHRNYVGCEIFVGFADEGPHYYHASDLNAMMAEKRQISTRQPEDIYTISDKVNLEHPLKQEDLLYGMLRVNDRLLIPHEKIFKAPSYNLARGEWQARSSIEEFYIDPDFSSLFPAPYNEYVGAFLNESVVEINSVEVEVKAGQYTRYKKIEAAVELEDLQSPTKECYFVVSPGAHCESLILFSQKFSIPVADSYGNLLPPRAKVVYRASGSVLSLIDINQGIVPTWDDLPYEYVLEGAKSFTLPNHARYFAVRYEAITNPPPPPSPEDPLHMQKLFDDDDEDDRYVMRPEFISGVGAKAPEPRIDGKKKRNKVYYNMQYGRGGKGGKGGNGGESTPRITLHLGAKRILVGAVAGNGGIGGAGGLGGGFDMAFWYTSLGGRDHVNARYASYPAKEGVALGQTLTPTSPGQTRHVISNHRRNNSWSKSAAQLNTWDMDNMYKAMNAKNGNTGPIGDRGLNNQDNYIYLQTKALSVKECGNVIIVDPGTTNKGLESNDLRDEYNSEPRAENSGAHFGGNVGWREAYRKASAGGHGSKGGRGGSGVNFANTDDVPLDDGHPIQYNDDARLESKDNFIKTTIRWI